MTAPLLFVAVLGFASVDPAGEPQQEDVTDTDDDNVPDVVERKLGTDPKDAGDVPSIPEPLYFDLVRNLGSNRGEIEGNVLAATRFRRVPRVAWNAELEAVPVDGLGFELEAALADARVEAMKVAVQGTIASLAARRLEVGALGFYEQSLGGEGARIIGASITGVRFSSRVHGLTIAGPMAFVRDGRLRMGATLHPSLFYPPTRGFTTGLELGYRFDAGPGSTATALPQIHLTPGSHLRVQIGVGVERASAVVLPLAALRFCYER